MGHAGMVGLLLEKCFQHCSRFLALGECGVAVRLGRQQRKRIKCRRLAILGIALIDALHRLRVGLGALLVIALLSVKGAQRSDVVPLSISFGMHRPRLLQLGLASLDGGGVGIVPELVPQTHGHSPMSHGTGRVIFRNLGKFLFCFLVPERMQ